MKRLSLESAVLGKLGSRRFGFNLRLATRFIEGPKATHSRRTSVIQEVDSLRSSRKGEQIIRVACSAAMTSM